MTPCPVSAATPPLPPFMPSFVVCFCCCLLLHALMFMEKHISETSRTQASVFFHSLCTTPCTRLLPACRLPAAMPILLLHSVVRACQVLRPHHAERTVTSLAEPRPLPATADRRYGGLAPAGSVPVPKLLPSRQPACLACLCRPCRAGWPSGDGNIPPLPHEAPLLVTSLSCLA